MAILDTSIQHSFGSLSHSNQGRKGNKRNPDWKGRSKTVTADEMIIYVYNPKDVTRKVLELSNAFSKVTGYTINMHKSVAYLYTNNKIAEREIKQIMPFITESKIIIYLGINLPKEAKDLYSENYKLLVK